jgi:hypothetical protein
MLGGLAKMFSAKFIRHDRRHRDGEMGETHSLLLRARAQARATSARLAFVKVPARLPVCRQTTSE